MLSGVTDCRRSQKWGCRGRLALGFKSRCSSHTRKRTTQFWGTRERGLCSFGGVAGENHAALAEWGPCGGDTPDGARSLNHELLLLFLRHSTPDMAERERGVLSIIVYCSPLAPRVCSVTRSQDGDGEGKCLGQTQSAAQADGRGRQRPTQR